MTFFVILIPARPRPTLFPYTTLFRSAAAGADYTGTSGTLNFAAGVTSRTIVVPILNDAIFREHDWTTVTLSGRMNGTIGEALGIGTILDDGTGSGGTDNDTPTLAVSD